MENEITSLWSPFYVDLDQKRLLNVNGLCYGNYDFYIGGETEDEKVRVDIIENQAMDFRNGFVMLCYADYVS